MVDQLQGVNAAQPTVPPSAETVPGAPHPSDRHASAVSHAAYCEANGDDIRELCEKEPEEVDVAILVNEALAANRSVDDFLEEVRNAYFGVNGRAIDSLEQHAAHVKEDLDLLDSAIAREEAELRSVPRTRDVVPEPGETIGLTWTAAEFLWVAFLLLVDFGVIATAFLQIRNLVVNNALAADGLASWMVAATPLVGGLLVELFIHALPSGVRRRASMCVFALAPIALLAWIVTVAVLFGGATIADVNEILSGLLDLSNFSTSSASGGVVFVAVTLTSEWLASTALTLAAFGVFTKHRPDEVDNPEYDKLDGFIRELRSARATALGLAVAVDAAGMSYRDALRAQEDEAARGLDSFHNAVGVAMQARQAQAPPFGNQASNRSQRKENRP